MTDDLKLSERRRREQQARAHVQRPRLLDRSGAAVYLSVSESTIDRLIANGTLHLVRLPMRDATARRVLVDVRELDALVDRSLERR